MRFLADMGISPKVVEFLQHLGHQAVHLQQQLPLLRKDRRSAADLISGTRQVRQGPPIGSRAISTAVIAMVALPICFGCMLFSRNMINPPQQVKQKADRQNPPEQVEQKAGRENPLAQKKLDPDEHTQQNRQVLDLVSRWEELYLKEHGSYTADPMDLLQKYGDSRSMRAMAIHRAIMNDQLRLELTDSGFRAMMPVPDAPDAYQVHTEKRDQGAQTVVFPKSKTKERQS